MTRYATRLNSATGAVQYDILPAAPLGMLRVPLVGVGIGAMAGASYLFGTSGWELVARNALAFGAALWGLAEGAEAVEQIVIRLQMHGVITFPPQRVQAAQPDMTPRPLPALAEIVMPDTPVSHAEREARHEAIRLLTAAAGIVGWDGDTIPRYTRLRWGNERRTKAVAYLSEYLDVTPSKETRVKSGTLRDLRQKIAAHSYPAAAVPPQ